MGSGNRFAVLLFVTMMATSFADAQRSPRSFALVDGKVGFVCEGPDVAVPAWGQFGTVQGSLSIDPLDVETAQGGLDVYMMSIRTDDAAWDTMFRRAGFLEIDEYPKSTFVVDRVTGAKKLAPNTWVALTLQGRFRLHGIVKSVSVPATAKWVPAKAGKAATIRVRASFHVTWGDYDIAMPRGSTRSFAGDGALIHADLLYGSKDAVAAKAR